MALYGHINEFNQSVETIIDYLDRVCFYLEANDVVNDAKKRAILLSVIGPEQFRLLKDLTSPASPGTKTFDELCRILKQHHQPTPPKFLCRAKFDQRLRQPQESISDYVAALRHLSQHCEFGETLNDRLCEKFVTGVNNPEVQRKLISEPNLTIDRAIQIATSHLQSSDAARVLAPPTINVIKNQNMHQTSARPKHNNSRFPNQGRRQPNTNQGHQQQNHRQHVNSNKCHRCLGPHSPFQCKFKNETCFKCNRKGHISKACYNNKQPNHNPGHRHHFVNDVESSRSPNPNSSTTEPECANFNLFTLQKSSVPAYDVSLQIENQPVKFQIDTGAAISVITDVEFHKIFGNKICIQNSSKQLQTYTGNTVPVVGECFVDVQHDEKSFRLPLLIVKGEGPPLLGRNWLHHIRINWKDVFTLNNVDNNSTPRSLEAVISNYKEVFGTNGLLNDRMVTISVKETNPKYCKPRVPPYAMREKIEHELVRLVQNNIIKPVESSDWATPIVPVLKKDGSVRICGDYKVTVNKEIEQNRYPIPNIEDIAQKLSKGEKFTELDFSHAYTQLKLNPNSRKYTTINTHKGLYQYERLCFGISSSPGIFQNVMDSIFQHMPNVCVYFDNVYVTGQNDTEHLQTLETVLKLVSEKGLKINKEKCQFMMKDINFLGHRLSKDGLKPQKEKVKAVKEAPVPQNVSELKAFLGMINYFAKFLRNLSQTLSPLHKLLRKNVKWHWTSEQDKAFNTAKDMLSSDTLLIHYDPKKKLVLTCDASPHGVAAILSHVNDDGDRPIAYASRSLNSAERNYSQLDREGLSIVFGVKKFHKFLYGRKFTIFTDHKPLLGLFGEHKSLPEHASPRVQRWAITLAGYEYELKHKPGSENSADGLSRLPLQQQGCSYVPEDIEILFSIIDNSHVCVNDVRTETKKDDCLKKVFNYVLNGWNDDICDEDLKPYKNRKLELSLEDGCILWGARVIIPKSLHQSVLTTLHDTHLGASKMKSLARSWFWWPQLDADIEKFVKMCSSCAQHSNHPAKAPLQNWDWPLEPWKRIHIDFAGPFLNKMFLIAIDSHSKWLEVKVMNSITAYDTIMELKEIFSTHGLPSQIVSDNGPSYTAHEFKQFCIANGIEHITSSPYHPATNGLAESAVRIFKNAMIKMGTKSPLRERVNRFLAKYRSTPHVTTGVTPSELLCGRKMKTHLDLLHPTVQNSVHKHQLAQKFNHDRHAVQREFSVHENVYVKNFGRGETWIPGRIIESLGPVSYRVKSNEGIVMNRHADHIKITCADNECTETKSRPVTQAVTSELERLTNDTGSPQSVGVEVNDPEPLPLVNTPANIMETNSAPFRPVISEAQGLGSHTQQPLRRSSRTIKVPTKLNL